MHFQFEMWTVCWIKMRKLKPQTYRQRRGKHTACPGDYTLLSINTKKADRTFSAEWVITGHITNPAISTRALMHKIQESKINTQGVYLARNSGILEDCVKYVERWRCEHRREHQRKYQAQQSHCCDSDPGKHNSFMLNTFSTRKRIYSFHIQAPRFTTSLTWEQLGPPAR